MAVSIGYNVFCREKDQRQAVPAQIEKWMIDDRRPGSSVAIRQRFEIHSLRLSNRKRPVFSRLFERGLMVSVNPRSLAAGVRTCQTGLIASVLPQSSPNTDTKAFSAPHFARRIKFPVDAGEFAPLYHPTSGRDQHDCESSTPNNRAGLVCPPGPHRRGISVGLELDHGPELDGTLPQ